MWIRTSIRVGKHLVYGMGVSVEGDLTSRLLTVNSDEPIDAARIVAAVKEAGYELAGRP
ncbi:hypothetical protein EDD27_8974 [Nonomuraea polychroma]|uniref:Copper chaperone CopZ n=1 Tax=Nonomuraea polychroma TaxID=46176 RepID=A0A438MJL4_9ACTN|nr:hypothetical protein EDD27_8974 [Nonomuraea polychroma]